MKPEYAARLREDQQLIEEALAPLYQAPGCGRLHEAMRYSLLAGGKRIRPVLTLEFSRLFGGSDEAALQAGIAMEMVHTYSLIHDDLPCMDNDDLRRGKPTSHKVFGEAGAVLAGDALLTEAFVQLSCVPVNPDRRIKMVEILASCAGSDGMVGGQVLDLDAESVPADQHGVERIQSLKTGALIQAACQLGVLCATEDPAALKAAADYAEHLGRAFQIVDDLLDAFGSSEKLGKMTGMDEKKSTFLSLNGPEWCREEAKSRTVRACSAIEPFSESEFLVWLAWALHDRDH